MHPTKHIKSQKSDELESKKIIVGVTGSIAAIMSIKLCRELIRHGAEIQAVMTESAQKIIHPYSLEYATGNPVIEKITGDIEHVREVGKQNQADLLLIAPSTANTIGKIASGIDDTTVTTFATTAISTDVPIIIVPAMHQSMLNQEIISEKIEYLKGKGINFIDPRIEEGKAKMASLDQIVFETKKQLMPKDLEEKNILVTGGPTYTKVDDVRILTNRSSGETGVRLAQEASKRGAGVTFIHGDLGREEPIGVKNFLTPQYTQMKEKVLEELEKNQYDYLISTAAVSDFKAKNDKRKLDSSKKQNIELINTKKIVKEVNKKFSDVDIITFKLDEDFQKIKEKAQELLDYSTWVVGNKIDEMDREEKNFLLIGENREKKLKANKRELSNVLLDFIN